PVEQPAPAQTRTRKPRDGSPSATPDPNFDDLGPMPIEPNTKPTKPRRNSCFPFCDSPPPDNNNDNNGNNGTDNPAPADEGQDRPRHF
ncbi:MAG TPA: hypothetical protein VF788_00800, partial [Pseudonocardiaceae bacterium]